MRKLFPLADQVVKGKDAQTVLLASGIKALKDKNFSSAIAFFDTCLKESPEDPVVNYYAGSARTQQAIGIEATDDKERLLNEAECYFKKAVDLKPDLAAAWNDWGKLLQNRSELCDSVYEREKLLDSAAQKYRKALSCDTNNYSSLYNLAVLLALQAGNAIALEQKDQALKYWQEADEIYTRASQIEIHHGALWFSWMLMLTEWENQVTDPAQKEKLARKQEEATNKGLRYTPDYFEKRLGLPPKK